MKKIKFSIFTIGLVALLGACGDAEGAAETPEDAAKKWCECVEKNEGDRSAVDCSKMLGAFSKVNSSDDKVMKAYFKAQQDCLDSK